MKKLLIELINNYIENLSCLIPLLNEKSKELKGFQITDPLGFLDSENTISYSFHGTTGIALKSKDIMVDFDVCNDSRCDGFNPFILYQYIYKNVEIKNKFSSLMNQNILFNLLEELTQNGLIEKVSSYNNTPFYFLKDSEPLIIYTFALTYDETVDWFERGIRPIK